MPRGRKKQNLTLPLIPLRGLTVFPNMVIHFDIGRPASVAALGSAMMKDQQVFLVAQIDPGVEEPEEKDLYTVGTMARVKQVLNLPGNSLRILAEGEKRGVLDGIVRSKDHFSARITLTEDTAAVGTDVKALMRVANEWLKKYAEASAKVSDEILQSVSGMEQPGEMADAVAANVLSRQEDRQEILDIVNPKERLEKICAVLMRETELAGVERDVQERLHRLVDKNQKDYYLREQIRAIQEELGEKEPGETEDLRERLENTPVNEEARSKISREIDRIANMAPGMPEINISRNWVEAILDMPWGKYTRDNLDLARAEKILNRDHYGMDKVKERVLEFLAVRALKQKNGDESQSKGPILCFVGPPGVGKTSIVRAIADALGRKYTRLSLGGVRDETEIRGHRRTYIGAVPGRIITAMRQAGVMNPLMLFDEIDKLGNDFRGDPASAMLEVLDGEQNDNFRDHYLEIPFDLSKVMFVTTANSVDTIAAPLRDRMEIIEVPSYTEEEKYEIAVRHLLPKQLKEHGLKRGSVRIPAGVMRHIIENYTREAGVRELERQLGAVARKAVVEMTRQGTASVTVNEAKLLEYLGKARYLREAPEKKPMIGVINGMAYTVFGGEMLAVECSVTPGTGQLILTGSLGDVMKESARAALTYIRAHAQVWNLNEESFSKHDIHIHVPEGATPKDGPSAGVTIAAAMVSALTEKPARQDVAMTGEITLRGRVLPIGGVKEKLLAAYRAGIHTVLLPRENEKDLQELPEKVTGWFDLHLTDTVDDVLRTAVLC